jgi:hypothetical protein
MTIQILRNDLNGHLIDLGLYFYIHCKYFLQRPNLLQMPQPICTNALSLSLSFSLCLSLHYLVLSPQLSIEYLKTCRVKEKVSLNKCISPNAVLICMASLYKMYFYKIDTRAQCYKTFYGRNLRIFVIR